MYLFFCMVLSLFLSQQALADQDTEPHFTFVTAPTASADNVPEQGAAATQPDASTLEQARMERRNLRQRLLDTLGISRFVPHGHFSAFGLATHWTMVVPDEETVALRVSARW